MRFYKRLWQEAEADLRKAEADRSAADASVRALADAVYRYLQVDGSHGAYDALELGPARRRLVEIVGPITPLTFTDLTERTP